MNGWKFLLVLIAGYILNSCEGGANTPTPNASKLLSNPPYTGITDSIERFPKDPLLYLQRALLLSQNNRHELATADYEKSWELKQDENTALEYASNLLMIDRLDDAIKLLKDGAKQYPDNPEFSRRLGEIYAQTDRVQEALKEYDQLLQKDPMNFETWYDKGLLLAKMKDTAGAIDALEKSFSLQPIEYSGRELAGFYAQLKNPRALEICDILLQSDSLQQLTAPVFWKGVYYSEVRQYDKALQQFDECIKRDWKMTDAYIEKGIVYFDQRSYKKALEIFQFATTVSNTSADAYYWIGRSHEAMGNRSEAITNYNRALSLDKYFVEAYEAVKRLS